MDPDQTTVTTAPENLPRYEISAELNYSQKTVSVSETVTFRNLTGRELTELVLIAEPNRYPNGIEIVRIETNGGETGGTFSIEANLVKVGLSPSLPAGEEIQLFFQYNLNLPAIPPPSEQYKPQPYGYSDRQTNLVDWYLFLPPLNAAGEWLAHKPAYFGEYLVYPQAEFTVELNLINAPDGLLVAASADNQSQDTGRYLYQLSGGRSFAISLNSGYKLVEKTVRGVTIRSYYSALENAAGEEVLEATAGAVEVYSEFYSPYQHNVLSVVEADFLDGMEYDGLYFLSKGFYNLFDGTPKGYLTIIAVHETAHQWFYGQVGNDQALEPWLDEAWCTFSELLFYENRFPDLVDWWWYYRVNYYEPIGFIDKPVYDYSGFTPYRNAVYLRGAQFLVRLRDAQGEEQFYANTKAYIEKFKNKLSSSPDFLDAFDLSGGSNQDLISEYFKPAE